jgi:hypothetical protein
MIVNPQPLAKISTKYRSELSASSNRPDELKSGLQKYVRRNEEEKALRCASEMYCFKLVDGGKSLYTNLVHRLMIIYLEDIGPSCFGLWELYDLLLTELRLDDGSDSRQALCWWVSTMCRSHHSRTLSHYAAVYRDGCKFATDKLAVFEGLEDTCKRIGAPTVENRDSIRIPAKFDEYPRFQDGYRNDKGVFIPADDTYIRLEVWNMVALLYKNDDGAFYWMFRLLMRDTVGKHNKSTKSAILVLDVLKWYYLETNIIKDREDEFETIITIAERWYRELSNTRESWLVVAMVLMWLLMCNRNTEDGEAILDAETEISVDLDTCDDVFSEIGNEIVLDSYVLDMHTRKGRSVGKGRAAFATEGAIVVNEDVRVTNSVYKAFYDKLKEEQDGIKLPKSNKRHNRTNSCATSIITVQTNTSSTTVQTNPNTTNNGIKESEYVRFDVRPQVTCSDARPDTYFGTEISTGRRIFVKGPYKNAEDAAIPVRIYKLKHLCMSELPSIRLELKLLVPDLFPDVPLGVRRTINRLVPQWFIVSELLIVPEKLELCRIAPETYSAMGIPIKEHTTKVWGTVKVVDWDCICSVTIPDTLKLVGKSMKLYLLNVLFRYVVGIPDPADRNFLLAENGDVYSTDEEGFGRDTNYWNGLKKKKCERIKDYIYHNWDEILRVLARWFDVVRDKSDEIKRLLVVKDIDWLLKRLEKLQTIVGIVSVFEK